VWPLWQGFLTKTKSNHAYKYKIKRYWCDVCDFSTIQHSNNVHLEKKDFKCDHCDKAFSQKVNLVIHSKDVHLSKKVWKCDHCDKAFSQKGAHVNRLCNYTSYAKSDLKNHSIRMHCQTKTQIHDLDALEIGWTQTHKAVTHPMYWLSRCCCTSVSVLK
jgi:ribosomal protein L37AE/L43A